MSQQNWARHCLILREFPSSQWPVVQTSILSSEEEKALTLALLRTWLLSLNFRPDLRLGVWSLLIAGEISWAICSLCRNSPGKPGSYVEIVKSMVQDHLCESWNHMPLVVWLEGEEKNPPSPNTLNSKPAKPKIWPNSAKGHLTILFLFIYVLKKPSLLLLEPCKIAELLQC